MATTFMVASVVYCRSQQPANYVDDPKYLLTTNNTEIWDKQGNKYHLMGIGKRTPSLLVFRSVNDVKVKFIGKKYFVTKALNLRPDLQMAFRYDTTAGRRVREQGILRDKGDNTGRPRTITISNVRRPIDFMSTARPRRKTQSWPLLCLDSVSKTGLYSVSKPSAPTTRRRYSVTHKDPAHPERSITEDVCVGDTLSISLNGETIKTGHLIAVNPNYEYVFSGPSTTNFRSWAYKYRVTDYGLLALPVTYQFGFGGPAANNVANLTSTFSFGGYFGCRFGNVSYKYGQFWESYHTFCVYGGGNEVGSSSLIGSGSTPPNSNYLSYSLGVGYLVGNSVFNAGLVASMIHILDLKSPYEYPYQNHAQLSIVVGVSLIGK